MNSGIRFSVALIVVIMVLLGFYYASLDDSAGQDADGQSPPSITVEQSSETSAESSAGSSATAPRPAEPAAVNPEPILISEPVVTEVTEDDLAISEAEEFDEFSTAEITSDPSAEADGTDEMAIDSTLAIDGLNGAESDSVSGSELAEPDSTSSGLESDAEGSESADSANDSPDDSPDDSQIGRDSMSGGPSEASAAATKTSRRVEATGVGMHRVATVERDQAIANAAMAAIADALEAGLVQGPRGSVWVPLPEGVDPTLLEGALVERTGGDETPHVLLLTGEGDAVDFAGRVQSTEVSGSDASGGWSVRFRLTSKAGDAVRTATRALLGTTVAWVADGRIVAVDRQLIPISGRGNVPVRFSSEAGADTIAGLLQNGLPKDGASASSRDGSSSSATGPTSGSGVASGDGTAATGNVVLGAGSLPPDQYTDYIVKAGDTFESIAEAWFGDRNKHSLIAIANPFMESSRLTIGEILRLPPKTTEQTIDIPTTGSGADTAIYTVRSGDTLGKIAQAAYGKASLWTRIYEANRSVIGEDPANLKVGMQLEIPR